MEKIKILTLGLGICFTSFLFWGCSKDQSSLEQADGAIHSNASTIVYAGKITMQNSTFTPNEFYVREKASVLWVNNDNTVHTVTANNGAFDSGDLQPGTTFGYTFNTRGDYSYRCKYHPEMFGVIKAVVVIK